MAKDKDNVTVFFLTAMLSDSDTLKDSLALSNHAKCMLTIFYCHSHNSAYCLNEL